MAPDVSDSYGIDTDDPSRRREDLDQPVSSPRFTWKHALSVGMICFLAWLLLDAPKLLQNAEASPIGARRSASIAVLRPIADVSRAIGLSHIVGIADWVLGRSSPSGQLIARTGPPSPQSEPPGTSPTTQPSSASTSTTLASPPTTVPMLRVPTAAAKLRVLIIGDSIGIDLGESLQNELDASGVVEATLDGKIDTGLTRPDYFNWPAELQADMVKFHPEVVIVFMGANDPQGLLLGNRALQFGTQSWDAAYGARVTSFMSEATSAGARVLWVGLPPMANPWWNGAMQRLNGIDKAAADGNPDVTWFPSWPVLSNAGGAYEAYLPSSSGSEVEVRTGDGVHLTPAGADRLASAVIGSMDSRWHLSLPG
jgi:hypothetical protein